MGRGIATLIHHELSSVVDEDFDHVHEAYQLERWSYPRWRHGWLKWRKIFVAESGGCGTRATVDPPDG